MTMMIMITKMTIIIIRNHHHNVTYKHQVCATFSPRLRFPEAHLGHTCPLLRWIIDMIICFMILMTIDDDLVRDNDDKNRGEE